MLTIILILLFITGFLFISLLSANFSYTERIGFALPVGLAGVTTLMMFVDWMHIPVTPTVCTCLCLLLLAAALVPTFMKRKDFWDGLKQKPSWSWYNVLWLCLLLVAVYIEVTNFTKCMYYPTTDRDSLAGFDTMGFIAAKEFTYGGMSIFSDDYMPQIHRAGSVIAYQPMLQLSYMLVYLFDAETSKAIPGLIYLGFLIGFYGLVRRASSHTAAMLAVTGVLMTPEMVSMSALSATNVMQACMAGPGLMYVCLGFSRKEKHLMTLGFVLLTINCWIRNEGVLFVLIGGMLALIFAIRQRQYKVILLPIIAVMPKVLFSLYALHYNLTSEFAIITHFFWDPDKAKIIGTAAFLLLKHTMYYGLSFLLFPVAFITNIYFFCKKPGELIAPACIIAAIFLYFLTLYHVDYKWDSIYNVLSYSAKRYMFCFIPMSWYFITTCETVKRLFLKVEDYCGYKD